MKSRVAFSVIAAVLVLGLQSSALANRIQVGPAENLKDLLANPDNSVTAGDKLFNEFFYNAIGDMPDAENIDIIPILDTDRNEFGIRIQAAAFQDLPGDGASDAAFGYRVTATDPGKFIVDATLFSQHDFLGSNTEGIIGVTETLRLNGQTVAELTAFDLLLPPAPRDQQFIDEAVFAPVKSVLVDKDIFLEVTSETGVAIISIIDQTFSQVPEPSSLALLFSGIAGLGMFVVNRRRR